LPDRIEIAPVAGRREPIGQGHRHAQAQDDLLGRRREGPGEPERPLRWLRAEKHPQRDVQGEAGEFLVQLAQLAVSPAGERRLGLRDMISV
jgi:hypothetical protein